MTSLTMAEGCRISSFSTPLFVTKPSAHSFVSLPPKLTPFHRLPFPLSVSLSLPKLPLLVPRVAQQTSDWTQVEDGEEAEEPLGLSEFEGEGDEGLQDGDETYEEPPEEAKLFVGNLPFDIDSESLAKLFDQAGVVEISEVIYNRNTDQSRGFGFVTMRTVEEAEKAVDMFNRYDCNGRLLTVNKAAPKGSTRERSREFAPPLRIYVGNLPWQVDDSRLEQLFSEHGEVVDARVVYDRESGRSRGFGFVTMSSKAELDDAISALDGKSLDGRAIRVNVAEERLRRGSF